MKKQLRFILIFFGLGSKLLAQTILGIDVYNGNGSINWSQVKASGKTFAWVKATEGYTFNDASFTTNMLNGKSAGVVMGAYHFARPDNNSATDEAVHFLQIAGSYIGTQCALPPALDLENPIVNGTEKNLKTLFTSTQLTTWVQTWLDYIYNQTGVAPIVYTNTDYATYLTSTLNTSRYKLWIAKPGTTPTTTPTGLGIWNPNWSFKQYDWYGSVAGINGSVDLNVYNGTLVSFNNLTGCGSVCTTPGIPASATGTQTGQTSANLSWTASTAGSPTVTYYWVVGTSSSVTYGNGVAQGTTTGTTASTTALACGTTYYLRVYANTSCDGTSSGYRTSSSFTTLSCGCLVCPSYDYAITPSSTWQTHPASHGSNGCKIYRVSVSPSTQYTFQTTCGNGASATFDTKLDLFPSTCGITIDYNDDACSTTGSQIIWNSGITSGYVYLKIYGYNATEYGSYTLAYRAACTAPPTPAPSVSSSTVCQGQIVTLFANTTASQYQWSGPNGFSSTSQNPTVNTNTYGSGSYCLVVTTNGCSSQQGCTTVTINPVPASVSVNGGTTQCGGSVNLTANGGSGGTIYYQGTISGGTSTGTPSTSQPVSASGTYYFRSYNGTCWGPQGSTTVTINPVPASVSVSGGTTQCGGTVTINASGGSGGTIYYQGTTSGGTSIGTPSTSQSVSSSGTYYFRSYNGTCWGPQGSATVTINSVPPTPILGLNGGGQLEVQNPISGTYQWSKDGSTSSCSGSTCAGGDGLYCVTVTSNGCTSAQSNCVLITGIAENISDQGIFSIVPNPNNGVFTVELISNTDIASMKVLDELGKVVYEKAGNIKGSFEINLRHIAKGIYFIQVNDRQKIYSQKLVIQ